MPKKTKLDLNTIEITSFKTDSKDAKGGAIGFTGRSWGCFTEQQEYICVGSHVNASEAPAQYCY